MAAGYHEPYEQLSPATREESRALRSLMEELEAIDWYQQRIDVTQDEELKRVLAHNRDEEIEHAAAVLEWLRRRIPAFDRELREILFTDGPIVHAEAGSASHAAPTPSRAPEPGRSPIPAPMALTVGRLQGRDGS